MNPYLEQCQVERQKRQTDPVDSADQQRRALEWQRFDECGWPNTRLEKWKYTSLSSLEKLALPTALVRDPGFVMGSQDFLRADGLVISWVDGQIDLENSSISELPAGVEILFWSAMTPDERDKFAQLLVQSRRLSALGALNGALLSEGVWIRVSPGACLEVPVFLIHQTSQSCAMHLAVVVEMAVQSQLTICERWMSTRDQPTHVNLVTAFHLAEYAQLTWIKAQQGGNSSYHTAGLWAALLGHAQLRLYPFGLAGSLVRHDIQVLLQQPRAECTIRGVYRVCDREMQDFHTSVEHLAPHCTSDECFKGVLDGSGKAVFNGQVRVALDAQKTQSQLANHNLLLSEKAEINTKPELEIFADDVRCSHGTTVGQLDENQWFYLRSRGIEMETARHLLVHAFTREISDAIPHAGIRDVMNQWLGDDCYGA